MRKFPLRLIPATILWAFSGSLLLAAILGIGSVVLEILGSVLESPDPMERWGPLFATAMIAWCLPVGTDAFAVGYFIYKARWKAALFAGLALVLLWFVCFAPLLWVLDSCPGPL